MAYSTIAFACLIASVVLTMIPLSSFAQGSGWIVKTSGGSLDIMLEQMWNDNGAARFKITFLNPNTTEGHQHQDYDVLIKQGDNQIFSAAAQLNQPLIHTAESSVTIPSSPFEFTGNGDYVIEVQLLGLGFPPTPIATETATFPITVTPEFPSSLVGIMAVVILGSIVLTRKFKLS